MIHKNYSSKRNLCATPKVFHNHSSPSPFVQISQVDVSFSHLFAASVSTSTTHCLSLKQRLSTICRVVCLELRRISTFRLYFFVDATKALIRAFVLSRIDYLTLVLLEFQSTC